MANGLYTNAELIDSIILDLNAVLKEQLNGQYINACCTVANMSQKLLQLRKKVDDDLKNREQTIETLKNELRAAGATVEDYTPQEFAEKMKKDGAANGNE